MRRVAHGLLIALFLAGSLDLAEEPQYPHGEFMDDCSLCHKNDAWTPVVISDAFDHAARGFALDGSHAKTPCGACHAVLDFTRADRECVSCHLDPHQDELGTDCALCHTPRSFIDRSSMIRAHLATRLPLDGAHRTIDCEDCHRPGPAGSLQFVGLPTECEACHLQAYEATTNPDHEAAGFSTTCDRCHNTRAWEQGRFNHLEVMPGVECVTCHLQDWLDTTDPDHQAENISQQCDDCHTTNGWRPASFDHSSLPPGSQCVSCHLDDYQATTNPDHDAANFPQTCEDCHTTNAWRPSTFNHDPIFPIYSGRHRNAWNDCADCHTNPSNYMEFTCTNCHDNVNDLAGQHEHVGDYVYDSLECYNCHPTGNAGD